MTITERLAEALAAYVTQHENLLAGFSADPELMAKAEAALAAYHNTTRPLEVGERVRVKAGTVHGTGVLGEGSVGTLLKVYEWGYVEVNIDGQPYPIPVGDGWTYRADEVERIA